MNDGEITIETRDSGDVTFEARHFEDMGVSISFGGDLNVMAHQIGIRPSDHNGSLKSDCGIDVRTPMERGYRGRVVSMFVVGPSEERRFVEWLHEHGADYVIETPEWRSEALEAARIRGRCANCGEAFDSETKAQVKLRQDGDHNLYYCSVECLG